MSADEAGATASAEIQEAERRGYTAGLNVGLVTVAVVSAAAAAWRSFLDVPRFEQVFRQVKVPVPGLTLLVFQTHLVVAAILFVGALTCIWLTRKRSRERSTIIMNSILFGTSLLWLAIVTASIYLPFMSVLEGIGGR